MLRCLIIEDEPLAADILVDYIHQVPFLKLEGVCTDALQGLAYLQEQTVDLLFLDIHLPGLKGLDFLRTLPQAPAVIITTAYHEYALHGYELNVVDYLLKPIEFKRFVEAVNKVKAKTPVSGKPNTITLHAEKKTMIVSVNEILYIESQKEYIKVQTTSKSFLSKYALTKIEAELDPELFLRVHRSFIINIQHLKAFTSTEVDVGGNTIPIGGNYKESVEKRLSGLFGSRVAD